MIRSCEVTVDCRASNFNLISFPSPARGTAAADRLGHAVRQLQPRRSRSRLREGVVSLDLCSGRSLWSIFSGLRSFASSNFTPQRAWQCGTLPTSGSPVRMHNLLWMSVFPMLRCRLSMSIFRTPGGRNATRNSVPVFHVGVCRRCCKNSAFGRSFIDRDRC